MTERFQYDNRIVKNFLFVTIMWGVVGMLVGLTAALQMVIPGMNWTEYFSFGRVRPLHTNAVIFAFVGNGIFAGVYYSLQRLLKTRMLSDVLSWIHFWGWQLIIVSAAIRPTSMPTTPHRMVTNRKFLTMRLSYWKRSIIGWWIDPLLFRRGWW